MSSERADACFYQEEQRFRQWWLMGLEMVVMWGIAAWLAIRHFVLHHGNGADALPDAGALLIIITFLFSGALLPALMWLLRLRIRVAEGGVHVRLWPLPERVIAYGEIERCYARQYRPILEYGGWGIRRGFRGWAYNVSGNEGVQLELIGGKHVLLGSQRAKELAEAIASRLQPSRA